MRSRHKHSFYINSVPYFAGFSCLIGFRILGFQYQGFIWTLFIVAGILLLATKPRDRKIRFPWLLWLPWFSWVGLSLLWSSGQIRANLQVFVQIVGPFIVGIIASYSITDDEQWVRFRRGFLHSLVFIAVAFVYFWFGPPAQYHGAAGVGSTEGVGSGPGGISYAARPAGMTISLIGCLLLANVQEKKKHILLIWFICVAIVVLSGSRMATIVLIVTAVFSPLYRNLMSRIVTLGVLLLLAVILFNTPIMQARFFYSGGGRFSDISSDDFADQGRFDFWEATFEEAQRHIIIGAGVGESDIFISNIFNIFQVHNDYLRILFELGVVGLTLFLATIALQILGLRRLVRRGSGSQETAAVAAYLGIITWLCFSATDNPIIYNVFFTHPLFALIGAAYGLAEQRSPGRPATQSVTRHRMFVSEKRVASEIEATSPHRRCAAWLVLTGGIRGRRTAPSRQVSDHFSMGASLTP